MFTLAGIREFHAWTHARLTRLLDHIATLPAGSYTEKLNGFGFPTIQEQVVHVFACEARWICRVQSIPPSDWKVEDWTSVGEAKMLQQHAREGTLAYLSGLTDKQLNEAIEILSPGGHIMVETPAAVIHHVLTHAFHHKGQIVSMCRVLGYPAPDTDLL